MVTEYQSKNNMIPTQTRYTTMESQNAAIELICGEVGIDTWHSYRHVTWMGRGAGHESSIGTIQHRDAALPTRDLLLKNFRDNHTMMPTHSMANVQILQPPPLAMPKVATSGIQKELYFHGLPMQQRNILPTTTSNTKRRAISNMDTNVMDTATALLAMHQQKMPSRAAKKDKKTSNNEKKMKSFYERIAELAVFKKIHGHCNVPFKYPSLGVWCNQVRSAYVCMKKGTYTSRMLKLNPERIQILERMGFQWSATKSFEEHLLDLKLFRATYGHCNVTADHPTLRSWCYYMRRCYKDRKDGKKKVPITLEQMKQLEALDFQWSMRKTFEERIVDLEKFKNEHGHCNVPRKYPSLGTWCDNIRMAYRRQKRGRPQLKFNLDDERIKKLESIGFKWYTKSLPPSDK